MKLDKMIDLAGLGLTAFIIFTLMKGFKGLADWLGGGKTGKSFKEIVSPEPIQVPEGGSAEITYQPPIPIIPSTGAKVENKPEKITVEETVPMPSPIFPVVPYIPFKVKKTIPKPPEKAKVHPLVKARVIKTGTRYLARKHASPYEFKKFIEKVKRM